MSFGKFRPAQPGDNRPRCVTEVERKGVITPCGRLASIYNIVSSARELKDLRIQAGLCPNHAAKMRNRRPDMQLVRVDRRKKGAVIQ